MTDIFINKAETWVQEQIQNQVNFNYTGLYLPNDPKLSEVSGKVTINSYNKYKMINDNYKTHSYRICISILLSNEEEVFFFYNQLDNYYTIVPLEKLDLQGRLYP